MHAKQPCTRLLAEHHAQPDRCSGTMPSPPVSNTASSPERSNAAFSRAASQHKGSHEEEEEEEEEEDEEEKEGYVSFLLYLLSSVVKAESRALWWGDTESTELLPADSRPPLLSGCRFSLD
ncbi:hypothetical protein CgunFtcFv8_012362 [Champsocephalus gunnari]|uniref:Uncharacterized protein n=1 Tax=Champsocephalus gunnari TaxID=52237 RepID=A0AAN8D8G7_CHAGU|nr:hypothetical protein CgunFtcFv8_012362 [Champsocephalus gunnari]